MQSKSIPSIPGEVFIDQTLMKLMTHRVSFGILTDVPKFITCITGVGSTSGTRVPIKVLSA